MKTTYPPKTRTCEVQWMTDPSHAWLKVNASLIASLGITKQITSYSYISGNGVAYLEEDCDAPRFFHAANVQGYDIKLDKEKRYEGSAPCRRLGRFTE